MLLGMTESALRDLRGTLILLGLLLHGRTCRVLPLARQSSTFSLLWPLLLAFALPQLVLTSSL